MLGYISIVVGDYSSELEHADFTIVDINVGFRVKPAVAVQELNP